MANLIQSSEDFSSEARERFRQRVELARTAANPFASMIDCACEGCVYALPEVSGASAPAKQMAVAGVRFRDSSRTHYFDPGEFSLQSGQKVLVTTDRGLELGTVVIAPHQVAASSLTGEVRPIARPATEADLELAESLFERHGEVLKVFTREIRDHTLPMKPLRAVFDADGARLTLYYSAAGRIDFRALVRDLAKHFRCRIELRQVGPRDEARLIGGLGKCGRPLCCTTWLTEFSDVTMTMARNQDLPGNPAKISGACGKLLCCLSFENDFYTQSRTRLPRLGQEVETSGGPGFVKSLNILRESVTIALESGDQIEVDAQDLSGFGNSDTKRRRIRRDIVR